MRAAADPAAAHELALCLTRRAVAAVVERDAAEGGDRETAVQAARLLTALMDGREVAL